MTWSWHSLNLRSSSLMIFTRMLRLMPLVLKLQVKAMLTAQEGQVIWQWYHCLGPTTSSSWDQNKRCWPSRSSSRTWPQILHLQVSAHASHLQSRHWALNQQIQLLSMIHTRCYHLSTDIMFNYSYIHIWPIIPRSPSINLSRWNTSHWLTGTLKKTTYAATQNSMGVHNTTLSLQIFHEGTSLHN